MKDNLRIHIYSETSITKEGSRKKYCSLGSFAGSVTLLAYSWVEARTKYNQNVNFFVNIIFLIKKSCIIIEIWKM